ncbi:PspA domain-containing protein [Nakamurella silvestris]|nr:PspA domain-containing protein [Nakamurella silvestris]
MTHENSSADPAPAAPPSDEDVIDAVLVEPTPGSGAGPDLPSSVLTPTGYTDAGVPTLDYVQDRIEARIGRALGTAELDQNTDLGRSVEQQAADREKAAKERLDAIRKSLGSP